MFWKFSKFWKIKKFKSLKKYFKFPNIWNFSTKISTETKYFDCFFFQNILKLWSSRCWPQRARRSCSRRMPRSKERFCFAFFQRNTWFCWAFGRLAFRFFGFSNFFEIRFFDFFRNHQNSFFETIIRKFQNRQNPFKKIFFAKFVETHSFYRNLFRAHRLPRRPCTTRSSTFRRPHPPREERIPRRTRSPLARRWVPPRFPYAQLRVVLIALAFVKASLRRILGHLAPLTCNGTSAQSTLLCKTWTTLLGKQLILVLYARKLRGLALRNTDKHWTNLFLLRRRRSRHSLALKLRPWPIHSIPHIGPLSPVLFLPLSGL